MNFIDGLFGDMSALDRWVDRMEEDDREYIAEQLKIGEIVDFPWKSLPQKDIDELREYAVSGEIVTVQVHATRWVMYVMKVIGTNSYLTFDHEQLRRHRYFVKYEEECIKNAT
jgi:hypothetical protein